MKRYYFALESDLAAYIGYTKTELHIALKEHTTFGRKPDPDTGKPVYASIAEIKEEEEMLHRIIEFQEFASLTFNFTCKPFKEPNDDAGTDQFGISRSSP